MILSRILMVLALAVLAYLVYITMTGSETFKNEKTVVNKMNMMPKPQEHFTQQPKPQEHFAQPVNITPNEPKPIVNNVQINYESNNNSVETFAQEVAPISYVETFEISGLSDPLYGAAPFGSNAPVSEGDMATVKYSGLVDAQPGDVIQIEGTDLLTAPLVDNMLYTNSIANTNRNSSQDLRGDIPLQFNDTYTPFYSSVIYGAPLSEKQMTIGKI